MTYFERQRGFLQFVQSSIRPRGAQRFTNCTLTGARARERCWKLKGGARVGRTRAPLRDVLMAAERAVTGRLPGFSHG